MHSTYHDRLSISVGKLCRVAYVASLIIIGGTCLLSVSVEFLDKSYKSWVLVVGVMPAFLFILCHFLLEARIPRMYLVRNFVILSFLALVVLLVPVTFVIVRHAVFSAQNMVYGNYAMIGILVAILCSPIPIKDLPDLPKPYVSIVRHIKTVMWDPASTQKAATLLANKQDEQEIRRARRVQYANRTGLTIFQGTLNNPESDSIVAARLAVAALRSRRPARRVRISSPPLTVLDIGGGDGRFTAEFLRELKQQGHRIGQIHMIDPVDWEREYGKAVGAVCADSLISVRRETLEDFQADRHFDVVIASHSLYNSCDGPIADLFTRVNGIVRRIRALCVNDGITVIVVASGNGMAYEFKREALYWLFGGRVRDVVAEDFLNAESIEKASFERIDSVINLPSGDNGECPDIRHWLGYFLRVPPDIMTAENVAALVDMLQEYVQPLRSLPEPLLDEFQKLGSRVSLDATVLSHKSVVFVI